MITSSSEMFLQAKSVFGTFMLEFVHDVVILVVLVGENGLVQAVMFLGFFGAKYRTLFGLCVVGQSAAVEMVRSIARYICLGCGSGWEGASKAVKRYGSAFAKSCFD